MADINKTQEKYLKEKESINRFMNKKNITWGLRIKVRSYIDYIYNQNKDRVTEEEDNTLKQLSNSLRQDIVEEINGQIISQFTVVVKKFSEDTINKLIFCLEELVYTDGEEIFNENDVQDQSLYLIAKGSVQLYHNTQRRLANINDEPLSIIDNLKEKQNFGQYSFFTGMARECSARASGFSTIFRITRKNLLEVISTNKVDYEKYCFMKDEIINNRNLEILN